MTADVELVKSKEDVARRLLAAEEIPRAAGPRRKRKEARQGQAGRREDHRQERRSEGEAPVPVQFTPPKGRAKRYLVGRPARPALSLIFVLPIAITLFFWNQNRRAERDYLRSVSKPS